MISDAQREANRRQDAKRQDARLRLSAADFADLMAVQRRYKLASNIEAFRKLIELFKSK